MPTPTALPGPAPRVSRTLGMLAAALLSLTGLVAVAQPAAAAGATVTGRLVAPDGKPVDAMEVVVHQAGSPVAATITGADGTFTLTGVPAGTYAAYGFDYFETYTFNLPQFTLSDGATRDFEDIELTTMDILRPNSKLSGYVHDPAGKPARGVQVLARTATPLQKDSVVGGFAVTDRTGRFMMDTNGTVGEPPTPGVYKLTYTERNALPTPETFAWGARYSGDQPTWARATTVTIDSELRTAPDVTTTRNGGVSGTITGTVPMTTGTVTAYDVDGEQAATKSGPSGAYSITTLRPGTYYLRFSSPDAAGATFVRTFWPGASSITDATPVVVKSGQFTTGISQELSDQLTAVRKPAISGRPVVGSTLTASPGSWSLSSGTEYSYEWLRGADVVGTAKTYRPVAADAGKRLGVRVTARLLDKSGTATSASTATVKRVSTVTGKATYKRSKKRIELTVRVAVPGLSNPGGTVTVKERSRTIKARVTVRNGKAVITVRKPKKGRHTYALTYSGTSTVLPDSGRVSVRVR